MHPGLHRAAKRRSAPSLPKRRSGSAPARNLFQRESSGFEGLISAAGSEDFFFSGFISDPEEAAEILEHGESRETFEANPRLELRGARDDREEAAAERNPLVVFMEEPQPEAPPVVVVPLVPVPEAQP